MQTKLTLRLDDQLIQSAKLVAHNRGKALSQLVADYFRLLEIEEQLPLPTVQKPTPWTQSLLGIAIPEAKHQADTEQLRYAYLAEKYQLNNLAGIDENPV